MKAGLLDSSLFEQWLIDKNNLSESSIYVYRITLECFLKKDPDIDNIEDYNNFLIDNGIKKRNRHYFFVIRKFIQYKFEGQKIKDELLEGLIKMPLVKDIKRIRRHLSDEQIIDLINLLNPKHRIIALLMHITGARIGDILRLKRGSIVEEKYEGEDVLRVNIIGKGRKLNIVYIHDKIAKELIWHYITYTMEDPDYYFLLPIEQMRGGKFKSLNHRIRANYMLFFRDLKIALNTIGIPLKDYSTHDFRRCFARKVWEKYKDVNVLKSLLNHADASTTLRYLETSGLKNIEYLKELQS